MPAHIDKYLFCHVVYDVGEVTYILLREYKVIKSNRDSHIRVFYMHVTMLCFVLLLLYFFIICLICLLLTLHVLWCLLELLIN